jgi:PAS domain S-box-containing protein
VDSAWTSQKARPIKGLFTLLKGAREPKKMTVAAPDILELTRDPCLAPHAMSAIPAWLFAADGCGVLWANASGAIALNAPSVVALTERTFTSEEPLGADIARLAETLPPTSQKYERLRDIGSSLVCACARVEIGGVAGILVTASEPARKVLPLAERAASLFGASSEPLAVFSADGALLYTNGDLEAGATPESLGGASERLGSGGNTVLVVRLPRERGEAREEQATEQAEEVEAREAVQPFSPSIEAPPASSITDEQSAAAPEDKPEEIPASPAPERPLRFVWTMDAEERFNLAAPTFADAMGPRTAEAIGKPWREIAAELGVDAEGRFANAITARDTFSGIVLTWPGASGPVSVELSGLPIFDRERTFKGYRGFGVCRDGERTAPNAPLAQPVEAAPVPPAPAEPPKDPERPILTIVPTAKNVVPFPSAADKRPALSPVERSAFVEIGETLKNGAPATAAPVAPAPPPESPEPRAPQVADTEPTPSAFATPTISAEAAQKSAEAQLAVLERLPVGVLIHRNDALLYANRAFLEWTGYADIAAVSAAGGLERLVVDPAAGALDRVNGTGKTFTIATRTGDTLTCEGRLYSVPWQGESALMLALIRTSEAGRLRDTEITLRATEAEIRELRSILDTATDGIVVVDRAGLILSLNRPAEALFGYEYHEIARRPFTELFAPESERLAREYLDGLATNGVASALNAGREVIGRVRQGGLIPLFMTMGRIGEGMPKFCAVLRDITQWKRAEEDLLNAKRTAERASSAKSDFLAKISHEIRTPLNAVLGFSEVILNEQFGALGNERYREYMRDIHASGAHLVSLINDLLDLSKIEAGKLDLVFASVNLNELVRGCVALMQPQANQQRIIIRSSLSPNLPPVTADARSVRQIVLNLLSNSIKFTGAGGQVIVSTAASERGEGTLRVRDTGDGMTEKEIETAMEPFRQLATSTRWGSGGTGLGLPLTKALAEANRARFAIKSAKDAGTLVEITFPGAR